MGGEREVGTLPERSARDFSVNVGDGGKIWLKRLMAGLSFGKVAMCNQTSKVKIDNGIPDYLEDVKVLYIFPPNPLSSNRR